MNFKLQCLLNSCSCLSSGCVESQASWNFWTPKGAMAKRNYKNLNSSGLYKRRHWWRKGVHPTGIPNSASSSSDWFCPFSSPSLPPQHTHVPALDDTSAKHLVTRRLKHRVKWLPRNLISTLIFYQEDLVIIPEWWRKTDKFRTPNEAVSRSLHRFSL